jgi:hypothetical protein
MGQQGDGAEHWFVEHFRREYNTAQDVEDLKHGQAEQVRVDELVFGTEARGIVLSWLLDGQL